MSVGKIASQAAHTIIGLSYLQILDTAATIVVLGVSDKKFDELVINEAIKNNSKSFIHFDNGYTEVEPGTATAAAWIELT